MMENETRCPNCNTTKYANANMRMMVNVCGHSLCENCVEQLFIKGAAQCPTCGVVLKRIQFRLQLYDDETVEKDLEIRRRLLKDIHLEERDFDTLEEFNKYLELFETFVHNLANNIDVIETNKNIDQLKNKYSSKFTKNQKKTSKDLELIERLLEEEREIENAKNNFEKEYVDETKLSAKTVAVNRDQLIDDLLNSDLPADYIMMNRQKQTEKELANINDYEKKRQEQRVATLASKRQKMTSWSGISMGVDSSVFEEDITMEGERYYYSPQEHANDGPSCPTPRTIKRNNYLQFVRSCDPCDQAGGFFSIYSCHRFLQEAIIDLTFMPKKN